MAKILNLTWNKGYYCMFLYIKEIYQSIKIKYRNHEKIIDNYFTKEKDAELSEFTEHGVEDYTPKEISDNDGQGIV